MHILFLSTETSNCLVIDVKKINILLIINNNNNKVKSSKKLYLDIV